MIVEPTATGLQLRELAGSLAELFVQLPARAVPHDSTSRARLFPPLTGSRDRSADAAWRKRTEPRLRAAFQRHHDIVSLAKRNLVGAKDAWSLHLPFEHLPAWIHTLNQARVVTTTRLGITPADSDHEDFRDDPPKARGIWQIKLYTSLLAYFLQHTPVLNASPGGPPPVSLPLSASSGSWRVVIHDDPVNLMEYVVRVCTSLFGYSREIAERHMQDIHSRGRSLVWCGDRATAEFCVEQLHIFLLLATLEPS
jgi:ATP-dependent Clp protease adaptor protein ClpS